MSERVPFRLTRNIVDGMGVDGVKSTFPRACEDTLRVLRSGERQVMTLMHVLHHDPLSKWRNRIDAERTVARVKQKLHGTEDSYGAALSCEGQVRKLIADAQDYENLCRMYTGWRAWC